MLATVKAMERRIKVDELRLQGLSAYAVAKRLKHSFDTICNDFKILKKQEEEESSKVIREQKRLEIDKQYLRQIAKAEQLIIKTLKKSKKIKVTVRQGVGEKYTETTEETYMPNYNAAIGFQRNLLDALAKRSALWGVEQTKAQVEVTGLDELLAVLSEAAGSGSSENTE